MYANDSKSWWFTFIRYCGTILPADITSYRNELFIRFHSDYSATRPGFLISYESVHVTTYCSLNLCKEGQGDCIMDSECEGSLVCGNNNCANSTLINCCTKPCSNDYDCYNQECNTEISQCRLDSFGINWSNCSQESPCAVDSGDCDQHTDCVGTLLCGNNNCASGPSGMDCCTDGNWIRGERQLDIYKVCHYVTSCSRSCYYTSYGSYINHLSYEIW